MIPAIHDGNGTTSDDFLRAGQGLALGRIKRAAKKLDASRAEREDAIRDAAELGISLRMIGEAAGISHVRVLQIVRAGPHLE